MRAFETGFCTFSGPLGPCKSTFEITSKGKAQNPFCRKPEVWDNPWYFPGRNLSLALTFPLFCGIFIKSIISKLPVRQNHNFETS
jgi:hypothetical protein